jgi:hypothetical protein
MQKPSALPLVSPSLANCTVQPLKNLDAEMAIKTSSWWYEQMLYQTVALKIFQERFDCTLYFKGMQQYCVSQSVDRGFLETGHHERSPDWGNMQISLFYVTETCCRYGLSPCFPVYIDSSVLYIRHVHVGSVVDVS